MYQSGHLRSQPPDPAEDSELRVLPFPGTPDPTLQSFLNELLKQYRDGFRTEESAFPQLSEQLELPLVIPSSHWAEVPTEAASGEPESSNEAGDVRPSPGMCDEAFESLLEDLIQRHQDAFRAETFSPAHPNQEPLTPLPLPSSLMPAAIPKSASGESEPSSERHYFILSLLRVLVAALAMILGLLLGMHNGRNRFETRPLKQSDSAGAVPKVSEPFSGHPRPNDLGQKNPSVPAGVSRQSDSHDTHRKASKELPTPGELTVFENDRVIFQLPASQDETPRLLDKNPD